MAAADNSAVQRINTKGLLVTADARSAAGSDSPASVGPSLGRRNWVLILSVSIAVCCFNLGGARTLTEHEIQVAGGAKQMAIDHDWLLPKIGDHLWLEKPPMLHWLMVMSASVLGGFSEVSVRLPSVLAALGAVILMTVLALHWFGARVAVFTGLLQTTTVSFITYARLAEPEMLLLFLVLLALFVFARLQSIGGMSTQWHGQLALLFWSVVGLSNMVKGLGFGPVLIVAPCFTWLILKRDPAAWRRMISWPGFVVCLALALAWPVAVALRAPEARELWRAEIAHRAAGWPGYEQPWWYYLTTAPWQLLPWTLALLVAAKPSLQRAFRDTHSPDRLIWCWGLVPIALLSLFHGKHHHYIISCVSAFTPLCAIGLLRVGVRWATVFVSVATAGVLFVHTWVLPAYDRSRDDVEFLKSVRKLVPPEMPLVATGGREIARHIFYVNPPPDGIWNPADVGRHFAGSTFYLITRRGLEARLSSLGQVEVIAESRHTRKEHDLSDRFTLFRVNASNRAPAPPKDSR